MKKNLNKMEDSKRFELKLGLLFDLIRKGYLKDIRLFKAFLDLDLAEFIPRRYMFRTRIYDDAPSLFYLDKNNRENLRTISAPHMISIMLQGLVLKENDELLILGAKSGYIAALAQKLSPNGKIVILEANSKIAKITEKNLKRLDYKNIEVIVQNPLNGLPNKSPWQKILVTGAIEQNRIYPLLKQLDPDSGVLFAPIGQDFIQTYTQILRMNNDFYGKRQLQVRFTPLITEVELDELELVVDFEEIGLCDEDELLDEESKGMEHLKCKNITIKYTSDILDKIELQPLSNFETLSITLEDLGIVLLENIDEIVSVLKDEERNQQFSNGLNNIETEIRILKRFKKDLKINFKNIEEKINQIRTYHVIRKELAQKSKSDSKNMKEKIEIINKQINELDALQDLIKKELKSVG
ncbi:MAG: hypothetical protein EU539_07005 [Promethearchaeota archaeon]|nr:MAG: hypothetical protein EU539_07005 [Candidatus Lokiarchaeota archaeon]